MSGKGRADERARDALCEEHEGSSTGSTKALELEVSPRKTSMKTIDRLIMS